ncbi:MYXO-CTERM sorting domain-containing protein [Hyalangium gracile]|uniref:MYXO-CTERM sorting domain-containing protein n=1 Tax=Hyalangium gracile TaxID=394092 RepID=UPI003898FFC9
MSFRGDEASRVGSTRPLPSCQQRCQYVGKVPTRWRAPGTAAAVCAGGVCVEAPGGDGDGDGGGCGCSGSGDGASMFGLLLLSLLGRAGGRRRRA